MSNGKALVKVEMLRLRKTIRWADGLATLSKTTDR